MNEIETMIRRISAGITLRHFESEADYAPMAEIFTGYMRATGVEASMTAQEMARLYANVKNCDPYRDLLLVEQDGKPVTYSRAAWHDGENEGQGPVRIFWFRRYLIPEWWDKGLERALVLYNEQLLSERAESQDFPGERFLEAYAFDGHPASAVSLEDEGYDPVRYEYEMVRPDLKDVPDLPLPEGLEVRPLEQEHLRAIWEAEVEAFRDHWGFSEPDEEDYGRWLNSPDFQPHLWQVAWDGDQVAGMIRNFINEDANSRYRRRRGYTENISVRRPWRRHGLARALLARSLRTLRDLGMTQAALSVDGQNPLGAHQLYESMGFRVITRNVTYRKPLRVE